MQIANGAFGNNEIAVLDFPERTDYPLQADASAFGLNKINSVQLPANTSKLDKNTFVNKDNVVVDVYIDSETLGAFVADETTSKYHRIIKKAIPEEQAPWGVKDFTYDEAGTTITGLADSGKAKDSRVIRH